MTRAACVLSEMIHLVPQASAYHSYSNMCPSTTPPSRFWPMMFPKIILKHIRWQTTWPHHLVDLGNHLHLVSKFWWPGIFSSTIYWASTIFQGSRFGWLERLYRGSNSGIILVPLSAPARSQLKPHVPTLSSLPCYVGPIQFLTHCQSKQEMSWEVSQPNSIG